MNERYTNIEIADKMRRTLSGILDIKNLTTGGLVEKSNIFIIKKRVRKRVKKEGDKSSLYEIVSYNVNDFKGEPLTVIPDGKFLKKEFKL